MCRHKKEYFNLCTNTNFMNNMSETAIKRIKTVPIILKKNKIMNISNENLLNYVQNRQITREDVLYVADKNDDLFKEFPNLTIVNKLNNLTNTSRTIATYTENSKIIELNSDKITEFLGQTKYDLLLNAISSVFNQNLKIRAILALLKRKNQGESVPQPKVNKTCQTDETCIDIFKLESKKKKRKQRCKAYVVDTPLHDKVQNCQALKQNLSKASGNTVEQFIDTKHFIDEDSNISNASIDNISLASSLIPSIVENPQSILDNIEKYSQNFCETPLKLADGSVVMLKMKPQDLFHIATPENLRGLSVEDRKKLMLHQAYIDWKYCLERDNDGNLPLHVAVLDNDLEFLRRQCLVLISRQESVDVLGGGEMSALQLSIHKDSPQCTAVLLDLGARVFQTDTECRSVLHTAAETSAACVNVILNHCSKNASKIIMEEEDMESELKRLSDDELAAKLLNKLCSVYDVQGYTPLMLASMKGAPAAAEALTLAAPRSVDVKMPTSGNTALYLTVSAAVAAAERAGNLSKVPPNYLNTIQILSKNGADPNIANDSGTSVTALLSEFKNHEIAQILANKVLNFDEEKAFDSFMLVKNNIGDIKVEPVGFTKQPKIEVNSKSTIIEAQENRQVVIKKETEILKTLSSFVMPPKQYIQTDTVNKNNVPTKNDPKIKKIALECRKEKVIVLQNIPITYDSLKIDQKVSKGNKISVKNNIPINLKSKILPFTSKLEGKTETKPNPNANIYNKKQSFSNTNCKITKINSDGTLNNQFLDKKDQNATNINKIINKMAATTSNIKIGIPRTNSKNCTKVESNRKVIKKFIVNVKDNRKNEQTNNAKMVKRALINSETANLDVKKMRK